ncbi:MAG: tetratricopeptide repeat protein [candidate division NC10 bacterium]|nr:tetratricopeptide repeat protein [candidate division NC10 bacterium]MBI2163908.1 tetratricopeptide repeat protein [candidate division NC10 bacterium]
MTPTTAASVQIPRPDARRAVLLVCLFALALYIGTLQHEFVWDDHHTIEHNQYITQARYLPRFFTDDVTRLTSGALHAVYYRPLFWTSFLLDFSVWGLRPAGFYLTNLLLYALACLLVFRLARSLLENAEAALIATLLFAAHPAHVETVAWVSGRVEPMAAIGVLLAIGWYGQACLGAGWRRYATLLCSLAVFGLALLSKETAASLPLILLWREVTIGPKTPGHPPGRVGAAALRLVPFFVVVLGLLWFRSDALARWAAEAMGTGTFWDRVPGSLELVARYILLAIFPVHLQPMYALARPATLSAPWPLAGLALLILSAGLAVWWRRRWPVASFGLGWFLLALAPVLDLMPVSPRALTFAGRYLFIPTIGLALLVGAVLARLLPAGEKDNQEVRAKASPHPVMRRVAIAASVLLLLGWSVRTLTYIPVFRDDLRLFTRMADEVPGIALGHQNLGLALLQAGHTQDALRSLERAVAVEPGDSRAQLALAGAYIASGRAAEGLRALDGLAPRLGQQYTYLRIRAGASLAMQEWAAAVEVLTRGLQRYPDAADLHLLLGVALERLDDLPRAEEAYRGAQALSPTIPGGHLVLARLLLRTGRAEEAASQARAALRLAPESAAGARVLALALEATGDRAGAREAWERALELNDTPATRAEVRQHLFTPGRPIGQAPTRSP